MSRFTAAGVPVNVLSTPTSFLYGAKASEGIAYVVNADSAVEFVQISDSTGTPGHPVPLNPGEWILLPYGAYNTIKTINGLTVYAQPGFLNKKQSLFLNSGEDIFNEEATDIFTHFTTPATTGRKHLINMTVGALKGFSLWDISPFFHVLAAETDQAGRINWKQPGTFTLINTAGIPAFAADRGFTVGSTSASNLGVNGALINYVGNAQHIPNHIGLFSWNLTGSDPPAGNIQLIQGNGGSISVHIDTGSIRTQLNSANTSSYGHGGSASIIAAFHSVRRLNTPTLNNKMYRNGQLITTGTTPPIQTITTVSILRIGAFTSTPGDFELALGGYFSTTTDQEHLLMYQVFQAYLSIIGAI